MGLISKSCAWNAMQVFVNSTTILTQPTQRECCAKIRKESALEVQSGWIECVKDVKRPSLDRREAFNGLWYQTFVQYRNGTAMVQEWVQGVPKSI